jgi:hypothetical protein
MSERKGIIFPLQFMGNVIPPNRTTRVKQLAALVDSGEHNSHDASVSTEERSINQLVNSGLLAYYSKPGRSKSEGSSRTPPESSIATYDKMSTAERHQLFESLGTLTSPQQGPTGKFSDGTCYEYDRALETTVEVTPTGKRFSVTLVAGKFQQESETVAAQKTAR